MEFRRSFVLDPTSNGSTAPTMKSGRVIAMRLAVLLLVCASASHAQFWQKKNPSKWSNAECRQLLIESPWVSEYTIGLKPRIEWPEYRASAGLYLTYTAIIESAWPLRRAVALLGKVAEPPASDTLDIHVQYSGAEAYQSVSNSFWSTKTKEELIRYVHLVVDGRRIQPLRVELDDSPLTRRAETPVPMPGFRAIFPQETGGKPILTSDMKEVNLEIADPNAKVRLPFNVKKMVVNGEIVY